LIGLITFVVWLRESRAHQLGRGQSVALGDHEKRHEDLADHQDGQYGQDRAQVRHVFPPL
jgi:hypothetical protein